jgi:2-succinyl-6-hydroxy-2,4-cyclohexadiene-1-carboxylate synthase
MSASRVKRVRVRGIEIETEEAGHGERAFVLVHGFTGSRDDWLEQMPRLAAFGRTLAVDQRGHGGSTNTGDPDGYLLEELVADLDAALTALDVPRCDLLGHSMGGMVAMRFALAFPERVHSLVLMNTAARPFRFLPPPILEASLGLVRGRGMRALAGVIRQGAATRPPSARRCAEAMGERFWERVETKLAGMDPAAYEGLGGRHHAGVVDRLGEIACPTLVLVGEEDTVFLAPADELEKGIPGARRVTIPAAAHSPQLENAEAWLAAIRGHLERVRA